MTRHQPLPSAWVARRGARRQYVPKNGNQYDWKKLDTQARYVGMHVLGLWPLWMLAFAIAIGVWAAGYQDGLQ